MNGHGTAGHVVELTSVDRDDNELQAKIDRTRMQDVARLGLQDTRLLLNVEVSSGNVVLAVRLNVNHTLEGWAVVETNFLKSIIPGLASGTLRKVGNLARSLTTLTSVDTDGTSHMVVPVTSSRDRGNVEVPPLTSLSFGEDGWAQAELDLNTVVIIGSDQSSLNGNITEDESVNLTGLLLSSLTWVTASIAMEK